MLTIEQWHGPFGKPRTESVEIKEWAGLSLEETVRAARLAEERRMKAWRDDNA